MLGAALPCHDVVPQVRDYAQMDRLLREERTLLVPWPGVRWCHGVPHGSTGGCQKSEGTTLGSCIYIYIYSTYRHPEYNVIESKVRIIIGYNWL